MAGAKTRFGFAGDGPEPPDSDEARGARTMIGRDIHLQIPQIPPGLPPSPAASSAPTPMPAGIPTGIPAGIPAGSTPRARAVIQAELPDEATAELPSRRARPQERHSRLARFLGRWTQSGRFVSDSRAPARNQREEDMEVPRDPLGRNVLLVLVVASVTFLLTLVAVKARQHFADKPAPAATSKSLGR